MCEPPDHPRIGRRWLAGIDHHGRKRQLRSLSPVMVAITPRVEQTGERQPERILDLAIRPESNPSIGEREQEHGDAQAVS